MDLSAHINYLLYRNDCVTLPGFGAFLVEKKEAYFDQEKKLYYPPIKALSFNQKIQSNDGLLASQIASAFNISYERAVLDIHQQTIDWTSHLQKHKLKVKSLGEFDLNIEGNIVFKPEQGLNFLVSSYSFSEIKSDHIYRSKSELYKTPTFKLEPRKSSQFIRSAAIAAGFMALFALGANYFPEGQAKIMLKEEQSLRNQARLHATSIVYDLGVLPTLEVVSKPILSGFHIIAGSFRSKSNADRLVQLLIQKGHTRAVCLPKTKKGFHQVSFSSFSNKREAYNAKILINSDAYPDVWVVKK